MNIYFSGIGGSGLSSLAHIAIDCGLNVFGSDGQNSSGIETLTKRGAKITIGQSYNEIQATQAASPIDWIIKTSALSKNHAHIQFAKDHKIKITKRDQFINWVIKKYNLKLIAIAGTHGKTTTTAMTVWLFKQLGVPVSYLIGSQISFGQSGVFEPGSKFFVLECDEFDRNFLQYHPYATAITTIEFDHPDIYKNIQDYRNAFGEYLQKVSTIGVAYKDYLLKANLLKQFKKLPIHLSMQSKEVDIQTQGRLHLAGLHNRQNALLAVWLLHFTNPQNLEYEQANVADYIEQLINLVNTFPGTYRRFEQIADNIYSDYAHHPDEIQATLQLASEL